MPQGSPYNAGSLFAIEGPPQVVEEKAEPQDGMDPHDPADRGPTGLYDDPLIWLVAFAAIATGIIGFRFHWGPGVSASASVDLGDETASVIGHAFATIAIILILKILVTKIDIPALQKTVEQI